MIVPLLAAGATLLVAGYFVAPEPYVHAALKLQRRLAGLKTRAVVVDDHRIVYSDGGHGEPLLMLHGFGATRDNYVLLARELTPHLRVITPDLPGYGDSEQRPDADYSLDAQLARIDAFATALGLTRFHLAGNSMGGYLAGHYARQYPQRVQSLWLIAPAGVTTAAPSEVLAAIARGENPLLVRDERDFDRIIDLCFVHPPYTPQQFRKVFARRSMKNAAFHTALFGQMFAAAIPFESSLQSLSVRTLITWGERDRILDVSGASILHTLIPGSELHLMPDTGHVPMMEKPRETAARFLDFQRAG
ncbi:MAG: alpha/beta fold hydrolase [Gammaproteobacteria bacterium]|nr:alpha/beta fold hydrolase [Gammaproteobacteria bacterium]